MGRKAERAAHVHEGAGALAPLEPQRALPRLSLLARRPAGGGAGVAARPARRGGAAGDRSPRRRVRLRLVAGRHPARPHRLGSRSRPARPRPGFHPEAASADRGEPVPVQVRRGRLPHGAAGAPLRLCAGRPQDGADHARSVRRAVALVVARRPLHRVPEPTRPRLRAGRQLGPLRRPCPSGGRAPAAHHLRRGGHGSRMGQPGAELEPGRETDRLRAGRQAGADLLRRAEGGGRAGGRRGGASAHWLA